jgi:hypothetical protein
MFEIIDKYNASNVLLFSSAIVAPIFETIVNGIPEFHERLSKVNIYLEKIDENSFGGNYDLVDSRVIEDYTRVIKARLDAGVEMDLILIPDAFGGSWGTDVYGDSYRRIAMEFGIPVERIDWLLVYGREV